MYLYSEYFLHGFDPHLQLRLVRAFQGTSGEITLDGTVELEVADIITGETSVPIGEGYLILTASDKAGQEAALAKFSKGDRVTLSTECSDSQLALQDWVSGSGNIIAKDGQVFDEDRWDSSITATNPRTAIGIKSDGTVVFTSSWTGAPRPRRAAPLRELAEDMLSMGCTTVVNMDGGGSSTPALRMPGKEGFTILNKPSDGSLRSVCSYILFVTDTAPSGSARNLLPHAGRGPSVLAGSSSHAGLRRDGQRHAQRGNALVGYGAQASPRQRERRSLHRPCLGGDG
ncbi:MAG: phosphodiester glycosidase family protein [Lachnospiraceae bacterium]